MNRVLETHDDAAKRIFSHLASMNFADIHCSPLINGGCGLGKTTALCSQAVYELLSSKLGRAPRILFVESRALVRDQLRAHQEHPTYDFVQYSAVDVNAINDNYDIIVLDEAHSLFSDSGFSADNTAPLCEWLRTACRIYQIYITASDTEFISFAEQFFDDHEFDLTFPDLNELHAHYTAQHLVLSPTGEKVDKIIARKASDFFLDKRGIFFIMGAVAAYRLYDYYSNVAGFKCAFYISQSNTSKWTQKDETPTDDGTLDDLCSTIYSIDIKDAYDRMEALRTARGLPTIRDSLVEGKVPDDIDFLFITDVGQEGISLDASNKLDFVFIEDYYPLRINQKIFRYRDNVPYVYIALPLRRLYQAFKHAVDMVKDMASWSQDKLEGYYLGTKGTKNTYRKIIWFDKERKIYRLADNYTAYLNAANAQLDGIRQVMALPDGPERTNKLNEIYGKNAYNFSLENAKETYLVDCMKAKLAEYAGTPLGATEQQEITEYAKELGLRGRARITEFTFITVIKWAKKQGICDYTIKRINHKTQTVYTVTMKT